MGVIPTKEKNNDHPEWDGRWLLEWDQEVFFSTYVVRPRLPCKYNELLPVFRIYFSISYGFKIFRPDFGAKSRKPYVDELVYTNFEPISVSFDPLESLEFRVKVLSHWIGKE